MNKNVIIISSSSRAKGNSDTLCDEFAKGAIEAGHTAEKLFLKNMNIGYCIGCGYCFNHRGDCPQNDDMQTIRQKMAADGSTSAMDQTIEELRGYLSCIDGAQEKGMLLATGVWNIGDIADKQQLKEAFDMGHKL